MKTMKHLKKLDVDKVAAAIEADAGETLPGLRESLAEARDGQCVPARRRGRPVGSAQAVTKEAVKIRLDADVLTALRASGEGWQTRINDALRASLALGGKI